MVLDYVYGHNEPVANFVAQLIPHCRRGFGPNIMTIGVLEGGMLIAGMVYSNWNPDFRTIEMSGAAIPGHFWLTRETLKRIYQYPFLHCNCQMVMMMISAEDQRLKRILSELNYAFVTIPRLHGPDRDATACLLTYEDWAANKICRKYRHHIAEPKQEAA